MISQKVVYELLCLTMLIYKYNTGYGDEVNRTNTIITKNMSEYDIDALRYIQKHEKIEKLDMYINDKKTDVQCGLIVSHADKQLKIIFRGSESYTDWWYNLQIKKVKYNGVKIHSGYLKQLLTSGVGDKLITHVKELLDKHPDYNIYITGHSAGAALSTIFSYLLSPVVTQQITVVSFASPRVGNKKWRNEYNTLSNVTHYRFVNDKDIITVTPYIKYYHCGQLFHINENGKSKFDPPKNTNAFKSTFLYRWSISDHSCDSYYKAVKACHWD